MLYLHGIMYTKFVPMVPPEVLVKEEADLALTEKSMKWQGKHIRHADVPVVRVCGPQLDRARLVGFVNS